MATQTATRDQNGRPSLLGVSCVDRTQLVRITIDSSSGGISTDATTVISFTPDPKDATLRDANQVGPICAVSDADDSIVLPFYVNPSNGKVLIDS